MTARSNTLRYLYTISGEAPKVEVFEVKEAVPQEDSFPLVGLIMMSVINLVCGLSAFSMLRKSVSGVSISVVKYEPPRTVLQHIARLKEKMTISEVDFNDKIFVPENIARLRERKPLVMVSSGAPVKNEHESKSKSSAPQPTTPESTESEVSADVAAPAAGEQPTEEQKTEG